MTVTSTISPLLKIGLRMLGLWPNEFSIIYWLLCISSILIMQYFQYLYVFSHFMFSELPNLVDSLPPTLSITLTVMKVVNLWVHRPVIYQILHDMNNDWRECIDVKHLDVMTAKANISQFCFNIMLSFNTFAIVLYILGDYVLNTVYFADNYNNTSPSLPIKIQFPFEPIQSPIYELLVITLFLYSMANVCTMAVLNGLIFSLVFHVSGQIDIIYQEFQTTSEKARVCKSIASALGMLIKKHNKVILFSNNIEKLFSFIVLMQVVLDTFLMCCLGFIIIISLYNDSSFFVIVKMMLASIAVIIETFIICYVGEYLSVKSKTIVDAACNSLWYEMRPNDGKIILLIILRSQRQLTLTAGNMMDLSLDAFANILKATMSYISVFRTMY